MTATETATPTHKTYNLSGLAAELQRQLQTKRDLMVDTSTGLLAMSEDGGRISLVHPQDGGLTYRITDHAHGQISEYLMPGSTRLYKRLLTGEKTGKGATVKPQPDLLANLANGLFAREPKKRLLRTMDGKLRAFLSNGFRPRDNWDLLDQAVLPELQKYTGRVEFKSCELTDTYMYVKVVFPDITRTVQGTPQVGDVVRGGMIIKNSEVGSGALGLYPYTDVLWCTNGAVHTNYGKGVRHTGKRITSDAEAWDIYSDATLALDDRAFFSKCRDLVRSCMDETVFDAIVADMSDLAALDLGGQPVDAVKDVTKRHDLTEAEGDSILNALIANSGQHGLSCWGMVNAITQTARDHKSADRRVDLETLAGNMVADPKLLVAAAA